MKKRRTSKKNEQKRKNVQNMERCGTRENEGAQKVVGAQTQKKCEPGGWRGPKLRAFSPLSRRKFRSFFPLGGSFSWSCGRGSRPWPTQSARLGSLRTPATLGPPGLARNDKKEEEEETRRVIRVESEETQDHGRSS